MAVRQRVSRRRLLSKSKYMAGLQCLKYLWLLFNDKDKVPEPDISTQHVFDEGHRVGELAKLLFPGGIDLSDEDFTGNLNSTREALTARKPLFEPGFYTGGYFSRLDILNPVGDDMWDIYEVKGSTSVKDINIHDVSFQLHCVRKAGLEIRNCLVIYINNQYVKNGDIDIHRLFNIEDVTAQVQEIADGVEERSEEMWKVIASPTCPDIGIGPRCNDPYDCPVDLCKKSLPDNTILDLYYAGKKKYDMFYQGIRFIKDIPAGYKLTNSQQIQQQCEINCQPYFDREAIKVFLNGLKYPVYFFDFETFNSAIPMFNDSRPFQQIPFQFSVHMVASENTKPDHHYYLADGQGDPRPGLIIELKKALGDNGSVVVYNQSFEKKILEQLGEVFPENNAWVQSIIERIVDLYVPFRSFCYYNPVQKGSASLKEVLPAVTGKSYEGMPISKGEEASLAFLKLSGSEITAAERQQIREDLLTYCGLDTEGMIWITNSLESMCQQIQFRFDSLFS